MAKVKVHLSLDPDLWRRFRMACLDHHTSASREVADLMEGHLVHWAYARGKWLPVIPPPAEDTGDQS